MTKLDLPLSCLFDFKDASSTIGDLPLYYLGRRRNPIVRDETAPAAMKIVI